MRSDIFGIPIEYREWTEQGPLPLYISANYQFQSALIGEFRCIMITPKGDLATIPALRKQIARIHGVDAVPVVLNLPSVSAYRRKALIESRIPFITPRQIFLPFMGAMLTNEHEAERVNVERFMASTQQLFLYYLYSRKERLYVSEATAALPFTAMTMSRAVRQLEAAAIVRVSKEGVNKVITSNISRRELFDRARIYLSSPVRGCGYIDRGQITQEMVPAGETALTERTMLNPGRTATYAVYARGFDRTALIDELIDPDRQVRLELWNYDPRQLSVDDMADSISVALSLMNHEDERVEAAVEELLKAELEG